MDKIVIEGGHPLKGEVEISGSKNAVLPIMAATLLADGEYDFANVPDLRDVHTMSHLLRIIGAKVDFANNHLNINSSNCSFFEAPYDLVKTMRASVYVLGPLVGRYGYGKVSLPGGCAWGPRPINFHIEGLRKMGADIDIVNGYVIAKAQKLHGAHISFDIPSVGATVNLLLASVLAEGITVIENAAKEPEVTALAKFLIKMGAQIQGEGTSHITINGVQSLTNVNTSVIPDRIEAGTFLIMVHATGGEIKLLNVNPEHLQAVITKLKDSGAEIQTGTDWIAIKSNGKVLPVNVTTGVYPGFPTDLQAQWMALMGIAKGSSIITDTIYHDRFTHLAELQRFGCDISLDQNVAIIKGILSLSGAPVMSTDLRASASLIIAGLVAKGRTDISRVYHLDRGYERIENKIKAIHGEIWRDQEKMVV